MNGWKQFKLREVGRDGGEYGFRLRIVSTQYMKYILFILETD